MKLDQWDACRHAGQQCVDLPLCRQHGCRRDVAAGLLLDSVRPDPRAEQVESLIERTEQGAQSCQSSDAAAADSGAKPSPGGSESQQSEQRPSSKGLLTITLPDQWTESEVLGVRDQVGPIADRLGCELLVVGPGIGTAVTYDPSTLVQAMQRYADSNLGLTAAVGQLVSMVSDLLDRMPLPEDDTAAQPMGGKKGRVAGRG